MAPYYQTGGAIPASGSLRDAVRLIEQQNNSQLGRAAAALILVQDQISYLMNGLDGGNYRPQTPQESWEQRFGDCKAKSLLLLAMLDEMGIESEAVLVRSRGGDVLPQLLPLPLNFDHVIVHAKIDGKDYWLDGTNAGASMEGIEEVPRFFHALPIREGGAGLIDLHERAQSVPDVMVELALDQRAGIAVPALYTATFKLSGAAGAAYRLADAQLDADMREQMASSLVGQYLGDTQILDYEVGYDANDRIARISASGLVTTPWKKERGRYQLSSPAQVAANVDFDADRVKPAWRDIPLRLNGPIFHRSTVTILLPEEVEI